MHCFNLNDMLYLTEPNRLSPAGVIQNLTGALNHISLQLSVGTKIVGYEESIQDAGTKKPVCTRVLFLTSAHNTTTVCLQKLLKLSKKNCDPDCL